MAVFCFVHYRHTRCVQQTQKIEADATVIENTTWQCQVAAIKSSSFAHTVGPPIANELKCGGTQAGRSNASTIMQNAHVCICACMCLCMCVNVCQHACARLPCYLGPIPQLINSNKWLPPLLFCQWGCKPINRVISHHNGLPEHIMALVHGWEWLPLVA